LVSHVRVSPSFADAETDAKIVAQTIALSFDLSRVGCRMARPSRATILQLSSNLARSNKPFDASLIEDQFREGAMAAFAKSWRRKISPNGGSGAPSALSTDSAFSG
jgi:hypothetical protein